MRSGLARVQWLAVHVAHPPRRHLTRPHLTRPPAGPLVCPSSPLPAPPRHSSNFCVPSLPDFRLLTLEFSNSKIIRSVHTGGVAALDLDTVEQRYLLAGAGDASLAVYDTQQPSSEAQRSQQEQAREAAAAAGAAAATNPRALRQSGQVAAAAGNAEHTEHAALFCISKQAPEAHKYSVSTVAWYPVDTGLFVSGGWGGVG